MTLLILAIIVVTLFVIGVSLLLKGYVSTPNPATVVPVEKLVKTQNDLNTTREHELKLKLQIDALVLKLDEAKTQLDEAKKLQKVISTLRIQETDYQGKIRSLEMDLTFLSQKADTQAQEAIDAILLLKGTTDSLKIDLAQKPIVDPVELDKLRADNQALQAQLQEKAAAVKQLEDQVGSVQKQWETKLAEATEAMSRLSAEHQRLKDDTTPLAAKLAQLEQEAASSKGNTETQLTAANAKIESLTGELTKLQEDQQRQVEEAKAQIEQLTQQLAASQLALAESRRSDETFKKMSAPAAALAVQAAAPGAAPKPDLEGQISKLKNINTHLLEKEKVLQLELTKSRMRIVSLEQILEDLKAHRPMPS